MDIIVAGKGECYDIRLLTQKLFIYFLVYSYCLVMNQDALFLPMTCQTRHPFVFHLFLDGPLLLRTISLLFSDDASPGRVIHYDYLSYSYDDASLRRVTLHLLR